jgi:hypothetical protein
MAFHVALQWPPENDIADERSGGEKRPSLGKRSLFRQAQGGRVQHRTQSGWMREVMKTFLWWFLTGAATTLGVLMVQGGFQDLISGNKSSASFMLTITGGGLLAGCIAMILNRIK